MGDKTPLAYWTFVRLSPRHDFLVEYFHGDVCTGTRRLE
jgi:hypothetical protein